MVNLAHVLMRRLSAGKALKRLGCAVRKTYVMMRDAKALLWEEAGS